MTKTITVLGGTGKTGRRLVPVLRSAGATVRTAARHDADVTFDWDRTDTWKEALDGADGVYLVAPGFVLDWRERASAFLDAAEAAGVGHVTLLSARGVDGLPAEVPIRGVELLVGERTALTTSILRPGWFMQNFGESFLTPVDGVVTVPAGDGAEAFVHAADIAEVAAATLLDPAAHAGVGYTLTGPSALTLAEVASLLGATYVDADPATFVPALVDAGIPADYAGLLAGLFEAMRAGAGSTTTDTVERVTGHPARSFADYVAGR